MSRRIEWTTCHQKPHRSFFFRGKLFPVCARCTGIHLGYLSMPVFLFQLVYINLLFSVILIIPTVLDGLSQAYFDRESKNSIRFITGLMSGIGLMSIVHIIGFQIGYFILKFI